MRFAEASCERVGGCGFEARPLSGTVALYNPESLSTPSLGTWDLGNSTFSTGFGYVYDYWVLGPRKGKGPSAGYLGAWDLGFNKLQNVCIIWLVVSR